jgi:1-acyl-sn-glycerol-3-phosphate acyltransferase
MPWLTTARFAAEVMLARAVVAARRLAGWAYGCYAWAAFAALLLSCGGLIILLQRPQLGRRIARFGARLFFFLTGASVTHDGLDRLPTQPHMLLVNHASYLDAIVLAALLPAVPGYAYTAKQEFSREPAMRRLLAGLGALFIERSDVARSTEDVDRMAAALARGENVLVFPEGTFSREAGLKPFHSGAFMAAAKAAAPLTVAGLRGTRAALREGRWPHRVPINLEVGPTLSRRAAAGRYGPIERRSRSTIARLCGEFSSPGSGVGMAMAKNVAHRTCFPSLDLDGFQETGDGRMSPESCLVAKPARRRCRCHDRSSAV